MATRSVRNPVVRRRPAQFSDPAFAFEVAHVDEPAAVSEAFHWHDFVEISVVTAGSGTYDIEDKRVPVRTGDIVVLNDVERHRLHSSSSRPLRETVFHFAPRLLTAAGAALDSTGYLKLFLYDGAAFDNRPRLPPAVRREAMSITAAIVEEWRGRPRHYQLVIRARLLTLVALLLRHCAIEPRPAGQRVARREAIDRLDRILAHIRSNLADQSLSLKSVAEHFGLNPSYFSDYFKRSFGQGFHQFLTAARIRQVQTLMGEKRMPVSRAAFLCGFGSLSAFYEAHRRTTGKSVAAFRNTQRS